MQVTICFPVWKIVDNLYLLSTWKTGGYIFQHGNAAYPQIFSHIWVIYPQSKEKHPPNRVSLGLNGCVKGFRISRFDLVRFDSIRFDSPNTTLCHEKASNNACCLPMNSCAVSTAPWWFAWGFLSLPELRGYRASSPRQWQRSAWQYCDPCWTSCQCR